MNEVEVFPQDPVISTNGICSFCGRHDMKIMGIYSEEGLQNDLPEKIKLYLPIKTSNFQDIQMNSCWDCVSIILSWHKFVQKVLETTHLLDSSLREKHRLTSDDAAIIKEGSCKGVGNIQILGKFPNQATEDLQKVETCQVIVNKIENGSQQISNEKQIENENYTGLEEPLSDSEELNAKIVDEITFENNFEHKKFVGVRRKKNEVQDNFFCDACDKGFTRKFDMQRHRKFKHPELEAIESYPQKKDRELLNTCKIIENDKIIFKCDLCNRRFNKSYNLTRHRSIHIGLKPFVCHICGKCFRLYSSFRKHIKQFHEGVKNFKCEMCQREFGTKESRDEHMNTHTDLRPFSCDICKKSFRQKSSLYIHKLYHSNTFKFECSLCDKKFRRSQELMLHNRQHTGHKPYPCDVCGAEYRRNEDLKKHKKIHLRSSKEWICQDCQCTFSQERYLKMHRKIHM
ncbi:hypothetical protein HHI36_002973 [Cryptolaemus montrouzieri]